MELNQEQQNLVSENINLVYSVASKMHILHNADAIQEGMLGLCMASKRYKPELSKFSTYAVCYIRYYIMTFINYDTMIKPKRSMNEFEYYQNVEYDNELYGGYDDNIEYFDELDIFYKTLQNSDDMTKIIVQMCLEGLTQRQIAEKLGYNQPGVCRKIGKLKKLLKEKNLC